MSKILKIVGLSILLVIDLLLVVPLIIPIPPLKDVQPVIELADPDSRFTSIDNIQFHYKTAGSGDTALVLLHGFGASLYSWREVMPVLAEEYQVFAYDRPAFGLTERPASWTGINPYHPQASIEQLAQLLDAWGLQTVILIGNSAGGQTAMEFTLAHPDRVEALILVSPAVSHRNTYAAKHPNLIILPQVQRLGPLLVRRIADTGLETIDQAWHDPALQPEDTIPLYTKPLKAENWDLALWHYSTGDEISDLPARLDQFSLPILLIAGDDDRLIPTGNTIALQEQLPTADLAILPDCGHVPQEECPAAFLEVVDHFLNQLKDQ